MNKPIDLYYWPTPNGQKISIYLEEARLPYALHPVDIGRGNQFKPKFLRISPNNKIPAIVDADGPDGQPVSIFESGAILLYLAEKTGKFLAKDVRRKYAALQWLFFQVGGVGPMLGQAHHFRGYAPEKITYAINRYTSEAGRLYGVMDKHLAAHEYFAGEYSIADMAIYPWLTYHDRQGQDLNDFPHLKRWFDTLSMRPAVQRGMALLKEQRKSDMSAEERETLFGKRQYQRR